MVGEIEEFQEQTESEIVSSNHSEVSENESDTHGVETE